MISSQEVVKNIGGELYGESFQIDSVSTDSRAINAGDVFVALKGENFNGEDFVFQAQELGARAVILTRFAEGLKIPQLVCDDALEALTEVAKQKRKQLTGKVVSITGSCGKTTVKGMLRSICEKSGTVTATKGNFNNFIGVPLSILGANLDDNYVVLEAGTNTPGEIAHLSNLIDADVSLVNNVQGVHLEGFGSVDAIADEKFSIHNNGESIAVVNLDDNYAQEYLKRLETRSVVCFSISRSQDAHVFASDIRQDNLGRGRFVLHIKDRAEEVQLNVLGKHNIQNALSASACAYALNISPEYIVSGLSSFDGDKGRMQIKRGVNESIVIDDSYNANPAAFKSIVDFLSEFEDSILVCGDMGELGREAKRLHKEVGSYAKARNISGLYAVGDYSSDYTAGFGSEKNNFSSKSELVEKLKERIVAETIVVVKGSRSAKMEDVVQMLLADEVKAAC